MATIVIISRQAACDRNMKSMKIMAAAYESEEKWRMAAMKEVINEENIWRQ